MYPIGISSNSSSNCSNSTNSINNSTGSNSGNSNVNSATNSTKISPSSSGITTPTRVSIKEANDHLQLLHSRVSELEEIIRQQSDQSAEQEEIYRKQLKELKSAKEAQIDELAKTIVRLEEKVKDLESSIKAKNERLEENQIRLTRVDQLNNFLPGLEELISSLRQVTCQDENVISLSNKQEFNSSNAPIVTPIWQELENNNSINVGHHHNDNDDSIAFNVNETIHSLIDMACQTDLTGDVGEFSKPTISNVDNSNGNCNDNNNNDLTETSGISSISELCSYEPCFSKRSSFDDTNNKEITSPERRVDLPISGDPVDQQWTTDRRVKSTRSIRSRRVKKSSSAVNCQYPTSNNWEKDFYCGPSLSNPIIGPGRTISYKIHSNSSSHLSGKVEKSFSITSNFSEDEDFPSNGSRGYHK